MRTGAKLTKLQCTIYIDSIENVNMYEEIVQLKFRFDIFGT